MGAPRKLAFALCLVDDNRLLTIFSDFAKFRLKDSVGPVGIEPTTFGLKDRWRLFPRVSFCVLQ